MCFPDSHASDKAQYNANAKRDKSVPIGHRKGDGKCSAHDQTNRNVSKVRPYIVRQEFDPPKVHSPLPKHVVRQRRSIAHDCRHDDDATCGYPYDALDSSESNVNLIEAIIDTINPIIDLLKTLLNPSDSGFRRRY